MKWDKQNYKTLLLTASFIVITLVVAVSLIIITNTLETRNSTVSMEMVEAAYARLIAKYGEIDFLNEKLILQVLQRELNTYINSHYFNEGLARLQEYKDMILDIFSRNEIYEDFIYIAFIKSLFKPDVYDKKSNTRGMWKLSPETARNYGLRVNASVDERDDPVKSTITAARYLKHLQDNLGRDAFTIILAAYDAGEKKIIDAARKLDGSEVNINFWKLYKKNLIPGQTKAFVIRVITFLILAEGLIPVNA